MMVGAWNRRVMAVVVCLLVSSFCLTFAQEPRVRLVYIIPKDRTEWPEFQKRADEWLRAAQWYFACQMQSHGLGWRTFEYEKDAEGLAKLAVVRSTVTTDDFLGPDCLHLSDVAYKDFLKSLPAKEQLPWRRHSVVVLFRETLRMKPDGTYLWGATRATTQMAYLSSANLRFGRIDRLGDQNVYWDKVYDESAAAADVGHVDAGLLRAPLRRGAYPVGRTIGQMNGDGLGVVMRMFGHALGMPGLDNKTHEFRNAGWLAVGHTRIRGNFVAGIDDECAGITREQASSLVRASFLVKTLTSDEIKANSAAFASPEVVGRRPDVGNNGKLVVGENGEPVIRAGNPG